MDTQPDSTGTKWLPILLGAVAGLLVGGGAVGAVCFLLMKEQERRHQEAIAALTAAAALEPLKAVGVNPPFQNPAEKPGANGGHSPQSQEEAKVLAAGKEYVEDLEKKRLARIFRCSTPEHQKKVDRAALDQLVEKFPNLTRLSTSDREYKLKKLPGDKGYEFYCTTREAYVDGKLVNFALVLSQVDGEWLIDDLEIARDEKGR